MSDWKIAMVFLLPLLWGRPLLWGWDTARVRTWFALMAASIAGGYMPIGYAPGYLAIDLIAAGLVLQHPRGCAQRAIGLLFGGMVLFHAGFLLSEKLSLDPYIKGLNGIGWMQFACLFAWGGADVLGRYSSWFSTHRFKMDSKSGAG